MFHQRFLESPYESDGSEDYLEDEFEKWLESCALVEGDGGKGSIFCDEGGVFKVTDYYLDDENNLVVDTADLESEELEQLVIKAYL